jgi:hypothetical protein
MFGNVIMMKWKNCGLDLGCSAAPFLSGREMEGWAEKV